jgi:hypothetical protein
LPIIGDNFNWQYNVLGVWTTKMMAAVVAATMVTAAMKGQPNWHSTSIGYEDGNQELG